MFGYKKLKTESKTEVPSQNNRQLMMRETLMKEYQTYCQLNHMLMFEQQKQQNMMEKRNERNSFNSYNQFYGQPEVIRSQL